MADQMGTFIKRSYHVRLLQERSMGVEARWVQPDHWSTQVLTGHENFRTRLASLGITGKASSSCGNREDNVQHFILECSELEAQRETLQNVIPSNEWKWPKVAV